MERLESLLARIHELSDDELQELADLVREVVDTKGTGPDVPVKELESLAAAAVKVRTEQKRRDELIPGRAARRTLDTFRATQAAQGGVIVPTDRRPRPSRVGTARAVTAGGQPIDGGAGALAETFMSALRTYQGIGRGGSDGDRTRVATVHANRPASRTLDGSPQAVTAALDAAAEAHTQQALTAAGGLAAPEDADYTLVGFEVTDRPVKTALPTFTAERGGVRFIRPPTLTDLDGAIGVWTVPNDIAAATDATVRKPSLRVSVGGEVVVDIQAVTQILTFGNMTARAYPEFVTRVLDLSLAAHARLAEQQLLTQIGSLSTAVSGATGEGNNLGATRVLLPLLDRAATAMRDRLRTRPDAPLQIILPHWARGILRSDLALQEPGDARVGTTDADLAAYLGSRYLVPTWALDGETGQQFNPQAPGAVNAWPTEIVCYMFPAGAFQFLDGGTLDLGLVRDSTLNAANDFQMFSETFEAVLFRGGEALRIKQAVTPNGIARAAAAVA